ncbi:GmrSD restriction endonuclease domain-containing protein [Pseudomonas sp. SM4]|uniref:GmrSD restriction endonuclease domain-containing protein n=1 Tax=Pseudomonas sp. SM4 TaxID=3424177 RepID=UPI003F78BEDE
MAMAELASQQTPIQSVYTWYREDKLYVNRRYQRKLVWTLEEKQKLVESILKKYPIPAILIAEREEEAGTYEIIDGLQRLHAIVSFIETSFPTLEGELFDLNFFPTALAYSVDGNFSAETADEYITQKQVSTLLDYPLALSVMRQATDAEINDVFDRINTYGHRLSDQERRQAGVQNDFSNMVRLIACTLRGDESSDTLVLRAMPAISIDLPKTKHGYEIQADEVFWVNQGILKSTDLRDSMDEQCIADIAACIVGPDLIERSKDSLDKIYNFETAESNQIMNAMEVYGADRFAKEFKHCADEILKVCHVAPANKLRNIVFKTKTTNAFPSFFAVIMIAFHELIFKEKKRISDYAGIRKIITNLNERVETSKKSTSPQERRINVNTIKMLIDNFFVAAGEFEPIYGDHATADIDALIKRSEIELPNYELKQGMLSLGTERKVDKNLIAKVLKTICAIANNGPKQMGKLILGVTDKKADADKVARLDSIVPTKVGHRFVVGIAREAKQLEISVEEYYSRWKRSIAESKLSDSLKMSVLSSMDYNSYFGLGVIVITIKPQQDISYFGGEVYWRDGDETKKAEDAKQVATIAKRF